MSDREDREDWRRERSLLALGRAMRGDEARPSSVSQLSAAEQAGPSWREDAAERHRLARSRREARTGPLLSALAEAEAAPTGGRPASAGPAEPAHAGEGDDPRGAAGWFSRWLPPKPPREADRSAAAAAGRTFAPPVRREEPAMVRAPDRRRDHPVPWPGDSNDQRAFPRGGTDDQQWKPLIDPMKVVGGVARSKWLILAMTMLGAALGVSVALSTPKEYEASAELIMDPRDLKLTDSDLTQSMVASDATLAIVENQVRVLTSGTVLNKVVDKLNLVDDPEFNGEGGGGLGVMPLIRSLLSRGDGPGGVDDGRRRALTVGNLAESLSVERGGKTFVITISATTHNGEKSALIANTMTDVFLQTYGEIQSDTAGRATDELTGRLDELRKSVETAERKVEDFRATHDLVDAQGHLISDDELLKLNEQLSVARARTLELSARAASARSLDVDSVVVGTLPEEINSNSMVELRAQYATIKQQADRAAVRLGPRHPERLALDAQLAGARGRISAELRRIASSLQVDLKRAVQLEQQLASRLAQAKVRSGDVNNDLVTLRELEREATAKRSVYEAFLLRAKETGERKDINTANMSVISKAFAPLEANGPSRAVVAFAGLLLGFASGIGLGAMRGAYESLRETADDRSRRRVAEDRQRLEDARNRPPPEPAPPAEPAFADERTGPVGALLSMVRRAAPRKAPASEAAARQPAPAEPASGEAATPHPYPVNPGPDFAPPPSPSAYPEPQFQQDAYQSYAYPRPDPYAPQRTSYPQARPADMRPMPDAGQPPVPAEEQASIEEIRAGLREFREAVRELTESRSRRRYF